MLLEPHFERISTNGITLRVAIEGEGPLVVLVHGWPELWLSWRHQIEPLVDAGYRVAVPAVRVNERYARWLEEETQTP